MADAVKALSLPDIEPPSVGASAAVTDAGILAFRRVEHVAEALQLPGDQIDAVLGAVEAATEKPGQCRRFVGTK